MVPRNRIMMSELSSYRDHVVKLSTKEPRTCLARFYPDVTYNWAGDTGPPPVGKCFNDHAHVCSMECVWHPDNPDKDRRIELTLKAGSEKNIRPLNVDLTGFWKERRRKWDEWREKTFTVYKEVR